MYGILNNYLLSSLLMFYIYCVIYNSKLLHLHFANFDLLAEQFFFVVITDLGTVSL